MKMSAQLTLGPVGFNQKAQAQHPQFGKVGLEGDGQLDFVNLGTGKEKPRDLTDDAVTQFIARENRLAQSSLETARANFEAGVQTDSHQLGDQHYAEFKRVLQESGLNGSVYPTTDFRGVVTGCTVHLESNQSLKLNHGKQGTTAVLESRIENGNHAITCPVFDNGRLHLSELTEQVQFNVPWLYKSVTDDQGQQAIKSVEDERLARLTEAADLGFLLPVNEMGPGWKSSIEGNQQTLTVEHGDQKIVLDSQAKSLTITASGWVSHGERDSEVHDAVVYQNGKFAKA